jgi:hypothetical protein
VLGYDLIKN